MGAIRFLYYIKNLFVALLNTPLLTHKVNYSRAVNG